MFICTHTHTPIIGWGSLLENCRTVRVSFVYTAPPGKETAGELSDAECWDDAETGVAGKAQVSQ